MMTGLWWWHAGVSIDRFSMTKGKIKVAEWKKVIGCMQYVWDHRHALLLDGKVTFWHSKAGPKLCWRSKKKGHLTFELTLGTTKQKYRYFQITAYSGWFSPTSLAEFQSITDPLLKHLSYGAMFMTAHVTHVEIAADFASFHRKSITVMVEKTSTSLVFKEKDGSLGTLYVGSPQSARSVKVYDKARQLKERWGIDSPYEMLTRVEATLRRTGLTAQQLITIPNPFVGLRFLTVDTVKCSHQGDDLWKSFVAGCIANGIPTSLKKLSVWKRVVYRKRLIDTAVASWQPLHVWKRYPAALEKIVPVTAGAIDCK